jgi:selenocysteine-specific elongation factor
VDRVIVGTAGHIDHGKTRLVEALTGIDCDRWIEEKERGITIDIGFAVLRHEDLQVGFIDVPGHERFVHNALAGLGGIRVVLLVIAADEGVKPQTREHLDICKLLEIPACLVALTKIDLIDSEIVELARLEVEELLGSTQFAGARIVGVSSKTGEGVETLKQDLLRLAKKHAVTQDPSAATRMPIDRAFHLKGLGVVVTGTLVSGEIRPGDALQILPGNGSARIRSIQVHGESREAAESGERTALQLSGVTLEELRRGLQLVSTKQFQTTQRLVASLTLLEDAPKALKGSTPIRCHLFSAEVLGRVRPLASPIAPGETGFVEIRLHEPVVAVRGDRFILRRPSPQTTLAGGEVLDPFWHHHRKSELDVILTALSGTMEESLNLWVRESAEAGIGLEELARRLGDTPAQVEALLEKLEAEQKVLRVAAGAGRETRWLAPAVVRKVAKRADAVLKAYFQENRLAPGIPKAEAIERILPNRARDLASIYLDWLQAEKILTARGGMINRPGRTADLTQEESQLAQDIQRHFETGALHPPSPGEVRDQLAAKPQIFEGVLQYLLKNGDLLSLPGGLMIAASAIEQLVDNLQELDHEMISVGEFKDRFSLTRKWAIPILEHLDSAGATRRIGDQRQIVRKAP